MYQYPKQILTIEQQVQSYIDAGMEISSHENVETALNLLDFIVCVDIRFICTIMLRRNMFRERGLKIF